MEKQYDQEEKLLKKLLNEVGTEVPSENLKRNIMLNLERRSVKVRPYQPMIPQFLWYVIGGVIFSSVVALYLMYAEVSFNWNFRLPGLSFDLPKIDLSRTMQYAIALVALFLIEVPFLKRLVDHQYKV